MPRRKKTGTQGKNREKSNLSNEKNENQDDRNEKQLNFFKVKESVVLGRHLVACKPIKPGEIILTDEAIVVGPCQESQPLCIGCYVNINLNDPRTYQRCVDCSWPLCTSSCPGRHSKNGHSKEECALLANSGAKQKNVESFKKFYYALAPFRCLILKIKDAETWKLINSMESHTEERRKDNDLWETNKNMAVNVIRDVWGLKQFQEEEIHFVCGILEVNAFEVNILNTPDAQSLRAIYPKAFLFAHNCVPNTCHSNDKDFRVTFRSTSSIPANNIITITYAYTLQSTLKRRRHLQKTKFFSCNCERCSDPTELGTFASAMKCLICNDGFLLPKHPLNNESDWVCNSLTCKFQIQVTKIIPTLDRLFDELDSINGNDIMGYERFLEKCEKILHKNNYLCLSALHCLSQIYGKIDGYLINDLSDSHLKRKIEICEKLIKIFAKLEPGLSKQRGILLYEIHAPLMILIKRKFDSQTIPMKEMKLKIKEVIKYLEEANLILSKEPEYSAERQMAKAAEEALANLKR